MNHLAHYFGADYQAHIRIMPEPCLGIIVVIPCFNEPDVRKALQSLQSSQLPTCSVEVILVVNFGEQANPTVRKQCERNYEDARQIAREFWTDQFRIHPILMTNLPAKHAGVGLARKIGMDEAAHRFMRCGKPDGIIACFDADATCDSNYFVAIEAHFKRQPATGAASIYYEHPVEGDDFPEEIYEGITQYELHLRYYNQAQRRAGVPFAYHTVGSSMLCTATTYAKAGGMNKRKAGEDFYFLQKLIPHVPFAEINAARVVPSPRLSDRVPFGTGRAMMSYVSEGVPDLTTYCVESFDAIALLVAAIPDLYRADVCRQQEVLRRLDPSLAAYLSVAGFFAKIDEMNRHSSTYEAFTKRFFTWFDAFATLKYLNQAHQDRWVKQPVVEQARRLLQELSPSGNWAKANNRELLWAYRDKERRTEKSVECRVMNAE